MHILGKAVKLITFCMAESFRHPFSKNITCTLDNPGTVTTAALPWVISVVLIVLGFVGIGLGEYCRLDKFTLYSSNMLTTGIGWIGGMVTQALKKKE